MPAPPIDTDQIVITASRAPESEAQTPGQRHHHRPAADRAARRAARSPPCSGSLLRSPSRRPDPPARSPKSGSAAPRPITPCCSSTASRSTIPRRAITPRFELLNADLASRIEVVRGPQSALWGSEADRRRDRGQRRRPTPRARARKPRAVRSACSGPAHRARSPRARQPRRRHRLAARDGHRQLRRSAATRTAIATSRAGCAARGNPRDDVEIGASRARPDRPHRVRRLRSAHFRPYRHARQQPQPPRGGARLGEVRRRLRRRGAARSAASLLGSSNRNFLAGEPINRTRGTRRNRSARSSSGVSRPAPSPTA